MKPQRLNIDSEALEEFRKSLDAALEIVTCQLVRRKLEKGTVTAKVAITIEERADPKTGEVDAPPEVIGGESTSDTSETSAGDPSDVPPPSDTEPTEPEATPEPTPESTPESTPEPTQDTTPEETPAPNPEPDPEPNPGEGGGGEEGGGEEAPQE